MATRKGINIRGIETECMAEDQRQRAILLEFLGERLREHHGSQAE